MRHAFCYLSPAFLALAPGLGGDWAGEAAPLARVRGRRVSLYCSPPETLAALAGQHAIVRAAGLVPAHCA
jgi:hypothetical protein